MTTRVIVSALKRVGYFRRQQLPSEPEQSASEPDRTGPDRTGTNLPEEDVLELLQRHAAALLPFREGLVTLELRSPLVLYFFCSFFVVRV